MFILKKIIISVLYENSKGNYVAMMSKEEILSLFSDIAS